MSGVSLSQTELDFLRRLLLEVQRDFTRRHPQALQDEHQIAGLELALALLQWDGSLPPNLDTQCGLGAAVHSRLGADAMCAYQHWRNERRRARLRRLNEPAA